MAITAQIPEVLQYAQWYIRDFLVNSCGVPVATIAYTDAAEQYAFISAPLPLMLIEVGDTEFPEHGTAVRDQVFCQPITVHRIAARSASGNSLIDQITIMRQLVARLRTDYRLGDTAQTVHIQRLQTGNSNPLQQFWNMTGQNTSLVAVSLPISIEWVESV